MAGVKPMPAAARRAAIQTFARIVSERHPGVVVVPLDDIGTDGTVVAAPPGKVIWPFATPKDRDTILDRNSGVSALDNHRVNRASQDELAILDG